MREAFVAVAATEAHLWVSPVSRHGARIVTA
jgi:hypothetical protein